MIISELCQNHNGDLSILEKMVHESAKAGATFCKIQSFFADDLADAWKHDYERIKSLELNWDAHERFVLWCDSAGMIPVTSVYTTRYADRLWAAGFRYVKIGSAQALNRDLIRAYMAMGFKVFLSTGGVNIAEVPRLHPLEAVFHCVSQYPTDPYQTNLNRIYQIKKYFPSASLGFSSHVDPYHPSWFEPLQMASMLTDYIEVHFTVLPRDKTKDGRVSLDFEQLRRLCEFDRLPDKLEWAPSYAGIFHYPQKSEEKQLITKYQGRWK